MSNHVYEGYAQYIGISHNIDSFVRLTHASVYPVRMIKCTNHTRVCLLDGSGLTYASVDYWGIAVNLCWRRIESLPFRVNSTDFRAGLGTFSAA